MRTYPLLLLLAMTPVTSGCVTLRPYDQAVRAVPAGDLLRRLEAFERGE